MQDLFEIIKYNDKEELKLITLSCTVLFELCTISLQHKVHGTLTSKVIPVPTIFKV